jgi:Tol biopolymer transport system component
LFGVEPWNENFRMPIKVASLDELTPGKLLLEASTVPRFSPPNDLVFARDEALIAQKIDLDGLELTGEPKLLRDRPSLFGSISSLPAAELSNGGRMLYAPVDPRPTAFVWFDREGGRTESGLQREGFFDSPEISHRGDRVAIIKNETDGRRSLWVYDFEHGRGSRVTPPDLQPYSGIWAPDDREIAAQLSIGSGTSRNSPGLIAVDGGQVQRLLEPSDQWIVPSDMTADGSTVVYSILVSGNREDIGFMRPEQGPELNTYLATTADETGPKLAPDGRWLAYLSDVSGKSEVYIDSFPIPTHGRRVASVGSASRVDFRADGKELFIISTEGDESAIFACDLRLGEEVETGRPRKLFTLPSERLGVAPAPMGDRFLVLVPVGNRSPSLTLVDNWRAQLGAPR